MVESGSTTDSLTNKKRQVLTCLFFIFLGIAVIG